jgi:hypothetical protein
MIVSTELIDKYSDKRPDKQYLSSYFKIIIDFEFQILNSYFKYEQKENSV